MSGRLPNPAGSPTLLRHGETSAEDLTYNAANELTQLHGTDGWTYFAYDANGNTITEQTPSYTRYFDWDGRDMMTGVRSTEDGWTDNEYRYDGVASRVCTVESGGFTYYDWDGINTERVVRECREAERPSPKDPARRKAAGQRVAGEGRRGERD